MVKKDIYEHLANIYLDASSKKKHKRIRTNLKIYKHLFFASLAVIFLLSSFFISSIINKDKNIFASLQLRKPFDSELALILQPNIVKLNFNFGPAQKEAYLINLNGLSLSKFKALGFSLRKADYNDDITLKIEFTDGLTRKSEVYLTDLTSFRWQDCKIDFAEFKNIGDWSSMSSLAFVIEERNAEQKKGIVYIDNIRFLR